jgi:hypothetical protein
VSESIHNQAVEITQDYLGPAAERFIDRQIVFHLSKDPKTLDREDIPRLAEWVKVSIAVLTANKRLVDEFNERILAISKARD